LFRPLPDALPEEVTTVLAEGRGVRIERIVSTGQASPPGFWYDQEEHEWVAVLTGSALLRLDGEAKARRLVPGDWVLIPAHRRHRVEATAATGPTVWLAVFFH
jgi:cupin 2 domain-containing protein